MTVQDLKGQADTTVPERTRLHITPLNETLLKAYIPPSLLPSATNISFHSLQTFPERIYGYVELPTADAERIKKKLNGAILKGSKVRIEEAAPKKFDPADPPATAVEVGAGLDQGKDKSEKLDELNEGKLPEPSKKRKREDGVLPGFQLPDNRNVKRGWTEPPSYKKNRKMTKKEEQKHKKRTQKSLYTPNPECLFRTTLPPNVASSVHADGSESGAKAKKGKLTGESGRETTVHEFANTKKELSFLKQAGAAAEGAKSPLAYVDGKGWVDEQGNLVEEPKKGKKGVPVGVKGVGKLPKERFVRMDSESEDSEAESEESEDSEDSSEDGADDRKRIEDETSSSGSSSEEEESEASQSSSESESDDEESESEAEEVAAKKTTSASKPTVQIASTKKSQASKDASSESDSESASASSSAEEESSSEESASSLPQPQPSSSSSSSKPAVIKDQAPDAEAMDIDSPATAEEQEIHPLEALFKKRPPPSISAPSSHAAGEGPSSSRSHQQPAGQPEEESSGFGFSFFGADEEDEPDVTADHAAPSDSHLPVASAPSAFYTDAHAHAHADDRYLRWNAEGDVVDHDADHDGYDVDDEYAGADADAGGQEGQESAFAKWFWENRGDTNRGWKRRRREAAKEQRQRENRRFGKKLFG
ncbi:hypothetical protein L228DRAFT_247251 [Xylona heveae TC161]|uniref:RRM domain-containing protein n=1 Tax=Xylona heveae (strain CBS 132557 / TC161) TaxID=1328760 RepID=A0A165H0Z3_XYLHT|nr:hypothetical protein L228DRAFT_247251 [Xylona heveae TC161]KZF22850.1 hypothetical protein L228DRAFT_247251 [Xylona heveae TC161]